MRACGGELLSHKFVNRVYKRFWKVASSNAGLVRDDDHGHASFVQAANGIGHTGQDTESVDMIQVADFFAKGAVAI